MKEVITDGKLLPQTEADQVVNDDVAEAKKTHAVEIKQLEEDKREGLRNKDMEFAALIEAEKKEHVDKIKKRKRMQSCWPGLWRKLAVLGLVSREQRLPQSVGLIATYVSGGILLGHALLYGAVDEVVRRTRFVEQVTIR